MNKKLLVKIIIIVAAIVPVIFFFWNIHLYAVNIPYNDDFDTVFGFMNAYSRPHMFIERFNMIFAFWNDHRQPFNKIVTLLMNGFFGNINIKTMIYIGNAGLLIIIFCLYKMFQSENKLLFFLPAIFLFFQPGYAENIYFGMASLTNFYVMAFGYLSVLLLTRNYKPFPVFIIALLLSAAAYFTQGNGILFLGTGFLILIYLRKWKESAVWALISAGLFLFYRFYPGGNTAAIHSGLKIPGINWLYFFNFIGNTFGASTTGYYSKSGIGMIKFISSFAPFIIGLITVAYFMIISVFRYYKKNPALYSVFLFLILSALGASIVRANDLGIDQAFTSRYRVVTIQFIIVGYLSIIEIIKSTKLKNIVLTVSLILSILFCGLMYKLKYNPIKEHRNDLVTSLTKWRETGKGLYPLAHPNPYANEILKEAVKNNFYRIPDIK